MTEANAILWSTLAISAVGVIIQVLTFLRLHTVVHQTNGMSHRLELLAGEAGEQRGRTQEKLKQDEDRP